MWKLPDVLALLERSSTEEQLVNQIGPPHAIEKFMPGTRDNRYYGNWLTREQLRAYDIFSSPQLLDSLAFETRMLIYDFSYPPSSVGGVLIVYIKTNGSILGWSYSKSLAKKSAGGDARMDKRNFEK